MNTGMLWFDNDPKTALDQKIQQAAAYFRAKYGQFPDVCLVHPSMLAEPQHRAGRVTVRPLRIIAPNHLWIGVEEVLPRGLEQ